MNRREIYEYLVKHQTWVWKLVFQVEPNHSKRNHKISISDNATRRANIDAVQMTEYYYQQQFEKDEK